MQIFYRAARPLSILLLKFSHAARFLIRVLHGPKKKKMTSYFIRGCSVFGKFLHKGRGSSHFEPAICEEKNDYAPGNHLSFCVFLWCGSSGALCG